MSDDDIDGVPLDPSNPLYTAQPLYHEDSHTVTAQGIKIPWGLDAEALAPSSLKATISKLILLMLKGSTWTGN